MPKPKSRRKKTPKRVLALPDLEHAKTAVLNSLTSASGQRTYDHAIREFVAWYCSEPRLAFNRTVVLRYRIHLEQRAYAPATINLRLAAVRRVAYEAADAGLLSPELAAGIRRVKGVRRIGVRLGNWLTAEQSRRLLERATQSTARQLRDHAMIAMLIGCGLRRAELLALSVESIQQREEHWVIADLVGKGGHVRTVPIPPWVKTAVDAWTAAADIIHGPVFRGDQQGRALVGRRHVAQGALGMSSAPQRRAPASTSSHRTIFGAPVPVFATWLAVNWTKSSSF
jgi:integrase